MSEGDSFLDEVTEEVRRDKLVGWLQKNAVWIGVGVVVIIAGAAGWEWRKSQVRAAAEARGAAVWAALEETDPAARAAALASVELPGADGAAVLALHRAAAALEQDDPAAAVTLLSGISADAALSPPLRDVVRLTLVSIGHGTLPAQERLDILDQLAVEGHPLRALALEQRALVHLGEGDAAAAVADLRSLADDPGTDPRVQFRAQELLRALGEADAPDEASQDG